MRKLTTEEWIEKAKAVHGDKYDYSRVEYIGATKKVLIVCPEHGHFTQKSGSHLEGTGCINCRNQRYRSTTEEFISKATKIHLEKYNYSKVVYGMRSTDKVIISCKIHGDFEQTPSDHLGGAGCTSCMACGFDKNKPAYLYYLKITTEEGKVLYKIGITNRTVEARFDIRELQKIEIVKQKLYEKGQDAWNWERKLLKLYKQYQYKGPNILESGNTELFTEDIIAMYYEENNLI